MFMIHIGWRPVGIATIGRAMQIAVAPSAQPGIWQLIGGDLILLADASGRRYAG
jgi:hypothetical protein